MDTSSSLGDTLQVPRPAAQLLPASKVRMLARALGCPGSNARTYSCLVAIANATPTPPKSRRICSYTQCPFPQLQAIPHSSATASPLGRVWVAPSPQVAPLSSPSFRGKGSPKYHMICPLFHSFFFFNSGSQTQGLAYTRPNLCTTLPRSLLFSSWLLPVGALLLQR